MPTIKQLGVLSMLMCLSQDFSLKKTYESNMTIQKKTELVGGGRTNPSEESAVAVKLDHETGPRDRGRVLIVGFSRVATVVVFLPRFPWNLPSRELTYPTWGKGKSSSKVIFDGIC